MNVFSKLSFLFVLSLSSVMADEDDDLAALKGFSLEALMGVEVGIAGKSSQKAAEIPAAVYVVTQKDIQRVGATNIPEALRMVPGMQVARIDANKWAVSIRGFSQLYSSKLLVMMDGRVLYSHMLAGVKWDIHGTMMEDIERIEVIRGPGATVWGANAVNGVINIITKHSKETEGTLVSGTYGTEQGIVSARYGNKLSDDASYRLYAKYRNQDNGITTDGSKGSDGWDAVRSGFRVDWQATKENQFTVQGDFYEGELGTRSRILTKNLPEILSLQDTVSNVWGANLLTRWTQTTTGGESQELQFYYDYRYRNDRSGKVKIGLVDLDYKYHFLPGAGHDMVIGGGYRLIHDEIVDRDSEQTKIRNPNNQDHLANFFIQDEISLVDEHVWLTLGSKFEYNSYTGFEIQPSARLRWQLGSEHMFWASVSRAVRTPSRSESDLELFLDRVVQPGVVSSVVGNPEMKAEVLLAYELGYRFNFQDSMMLDVNVFYNDYDQLRSFTPSELLLPNETRPFAIFQAQFGNDVTAETYGLEISFDWQASEKLDFRTSYTLLDIQIHHGNSVLSKAFAESIEGQDPHHRINVVASYELAQGLTLNGVARYVDRLPASNVDSLVDFDMGLSWQATDNLAVTLYGKNLVHGERLEYQQSILSTLSIQLEREVFMKVDVSF